MTASAPTPTIDQLRARLDGRAIGPEDPGYDAARTVFPGGIDRRPALIAQPRDAAEVAGVVDLARDAGLELTVRAGGHSGAGHGVADGAIMLDLRGLSGIEIDPGSRTAWAGGGLTAGEYTEAAAEHGLATGFGDTGTVGIGGLTLGGGIGFLSRAHGLTIDNLLAAEIVTAAGDVVTADADNHPDLFWAIRGGGGSFGVATRLRFRLAELDSVVGGPLILPASAEVLEGLIAAAEQAPDELSAIVNVMPAPPVPFVPAELHGQVVILALVCYAGPAEEGERALAPFRALATPVADLARPISYPELFPPGEEGFHPTAFVRTMFVDRVDRDAAETIVGAISSSDAPMRLVQLRVLGGAIARVPAEATAYAHRDSRIMANVASFYEGPDDRPRRAAWVRELAEEIHRGEDRGAYVNFLENEPDRIRAAYPDATWDRLTEIKARYDPANLFRHNSNIPPAPTS